MKWSTVCPWVLIHYIHIKKTILQSELCKPLDAAGGRKFTAQARQLDIPRGTQAEPRQPKDRHKSNLFLCRRQHLRLLLVCPTFGLGVSGRQSLALYNWLGQSILLRLAMKVTCQDRNSSGREWIWWDFCKRTLSMCDLSTFAWF